MIICKCWHSSFFKSLPPALGIPVMSLTTGILNIHSFVLWLNANFHYPLKMNLKTFFFLLLLSTVRFYFKTDYDTYMLLYKYNSTLIRNLQYSFDYILQSNTVWYSTYFLPFLFYLYALCFDICKFYVTWGTLCSFFNSPSVAVDTFSINDKETISKETKQG